MAFGGIALKGVSLIWRFIQFCCAGIILGIFSYFLAVLADHHLHIDTYIRAVEGISGAATLYTLIALVLVCCLGGIAVFGFLAMLLDLAFTGAFVYVAYATRHGDNSCSGVVNTPLGTGDAGTDNKVASNDGGVVILPKYRTACKLNTACFAVAIIGAVFFFTSIFIEFALIKHHKKEKAFGPSPNNGYTAGSPKRRFWQRKPKSTRDAEIGEKPDALPAHATPADTRHSYATESTAVGTNQEPTYEKYGPTATGGAGPAHGVVHQNGYQTTTTTHVPAQGYTNNNTTGTF